MIAHVTAKNVGILFWNTVYAEHDHE